MTRVLDTSAVLAHFMGENGGEVVQSILLEVNDICCVHSVNWVEIYYKMHGKGGEKAARLAADDLRFFKVSIIDISGEDFLRRVAEIKVAHPYLAVGDCYAIGLAGWLNAEVVTADSFFEKAKAFARIRRIR